MATATDSYPKPGVRRAKANGQAVLEDPVCHLLDAFRVPYELIQRAGLRRVKNDAAWKEGFYLKGKPRPDLTGWVFPYKNHEGVEYTARLRRDYPSDDSKYVLKLHAPRLLYWPPGALEKLTAPDSKTFALLVESEKAALAITAWAERTGWDWVAVAMGGCWGWKAKDPETKISLPIDDLNLLRGHATGILLDANADTNPQVVRAERDLRNYLSGMLRSEVPCYRLPIEPGVNGPDDYLARHTDEEFAVLLAKPAPEEESTLSTGNKMTSEFCARLETTLSAQPECRLFVHATELVRLIEETRKYDEKLPFSRPEGNTYLVRVDGTYLNRALNNTGLVRSSKGVSVNAPSDWGRNLMSRAKSEPDLLRWRNLNAIATVPFLLEDGSLVDQPGYHAATGIYLDTRKKKFPSIPAHPTKAEARAALDKLKEVFKEFCFKPTKAETWAETPSYAVVLSTIASLLLRNLVPTVLLQGVNAPKAGTGKTILCKSETIIGTGLPPAHMGYDDMKEFDKELPVPLADGDRAILIDNVDRMFRSARLTRVLTEPPTTLHKFRVLGETRDQFVTNNAVFMVNGNGLRIFGELTRRSLLVDLESNAENPEDVPHSFDAPNRAQENFPELAMAVLTAGRYYLQKKCPRPKLPDAPETIGSFVVWDKLIRGMLVHLDFADPLATQKEVRQLDPARQDDAELLEALQAISPKGETFTVSEIADMCKTPGSIALRAFNLLSQTEADGHGRTQWNAWTAAHRLMKLRGKVIDGRKLVMKEGKGAKNKTLYAVVKVSAEVS